MSVSPENIQPFIFGAYCGCLTIGICLSIAVIKKIKTLDLHTWLISLLYILMAASFLNQYELRKEIFKLGFNLLDFMEIVKDLFKVVK